MLVLVTLQYLSLSLQIQVRTQKIRDVLPADLMGLGDCISLLAAVLLLPDTDFLSQLLLRLESEILEANEFAFVLFTFELNLEFLF